jgi:hypothetical protein
MLIGLVVAICNAVDFTVDGFAECADGARRCGGYYLLVYSYSPASPAS